MDVGELVRVELGRHDWASLRCGCGDSAEHVPLLFEAIITAESPRDMIGYTLDRHVEVNTVLFECTVPAVSVILAALAGELSTPSASRTPPDPVVRGCRLGSRQRTGSRAVRLG